MLIFFSRTSGRRITIQNQGGHDNDGFLGLFLYPTPSSSVQVAERSETDSGRLVRPTRRSAGRSSRPDLDSVRSVRTPSRQEWVAEHSASRSERLRVGFGALGEEYQTSGVGGGVHGDVVEAARCWFRCCHFHNKTADPMEKLYTNRLPTQKLETCNPLTIGVYKPWKR